MKFKNKTVIFLILFCILVLIEPFLSGLTDQSKASNFIVDFHNYSLLKNDLPIEINGNIELAAEASTGEGTYSKPFIIENKVIDNGEPGNCILIKNTNKYFILRNCTIKYGNSYLSSGIRLENVTNGNLINNSIDHNNIGIYLDSSWNITVISNKVNENNIYGIYLSFSWNNSLINNTANFNNLNGIYLYSSWNNTLINNTANFNENNGIYLDSSSDNYLAVNTANANYNNGIYLSASNSNNLTNNIANDNSNGIELFFSNDNAITGNTLIDNSEGIYEDSSCENNDIKDNIVHDRTNHNWFLIIAIIISLFLFIFVVVFVWRRRLIED
ncbi:MAG: right-handed parallel beta-helix repeat-containing protein [Candidatus Helarchaeota archaeon]